MDTKQRKFGQIFYKCRLLCWKNAILFWSEMHELILMLCVLGVSIAALQYWRSQVPTEKRENTFYDPFSVDDLNVFREEMEKLKEIDPEYEFQMKIGYSPQNKLLDNVIKDAAKKLDVSYEAFQNYEELELEYVSRNFIAGIQFDDSLSNMEVYPKNISYSLRFPTTLRFCPHQTWKTSYILPENARGPRNPEDNDGGCNVGYLREGFLPIQHAVSMSYIAKSTFRSEENLPKVQMQRYPYQNYIKDDLIAKLKLWLSFAVGFCYTAIYYFIVKNIVYETEYKLTDIIKMNGIEIWIQIITWFLTDLLILTIYAIILCILLTVKISENGAILNYIDYLPLLFFMIIFSIHTICFCFIIAILFDKAHFAGITAAFICYMTCTPGIDELNMNSPPAKLFFSLIPNIALSFGYNIILNYEAESEDLQWHNIFHPVNETETVSLGLLIVFMLMYSIIFMLITWYVEVYMSGIMQIFYSIHSILKLKFLRKKKEKEEFKEQLSLDERSMYEFEQQPIGRPRGVKVKNLWKKIDNDTIPVKAFTMNMHKDEITVLLGHEGSGKTTLIGMLIGTVKPTAGTAIIYGYDILKNIDEARRIIGIVPAKNILFRYMSVSNHIRFYARLRGLRKPEIKEQLKKYLKVLNLERKPNTKPAKLSIDMKRKLAIICAMVGDTKVLFCDEPTRGVQAELKHQVWDLLQKEKIGRTIFLTTNSKYEADAVGDRIGIMYQGELVCYGTPFYLKKRLGPGYYLICRKKKNCDILKLHMIVSQYVPVAIYQNYDKEVAFILPDRFSPKFGSLLKELETNADYFEIEKCSIYVATMDEVFMRTGTGNFNENTSSVGGPAEIDAPCADSCESICKISKPSGSIYTDEGRPVKGIDWYLNYQWKAMFLKRYYQTRHKWRTVLFSNLIPIIFIGLPIFSMYINTISMQYPPLTINLQLYEREVIVMDDLHMNPEDTNIRENYKIIVESRGKDGTFKKVETSDMQYYILSLPQYITNRNYLGGITFTENILTAWFNNEFYHTSTLSLAILHEAILRSIQGPTTSITVVNDPFPPTKNMLIKEAKKIQHFFVNFTILLTFFASIIFYCSLAFVVKENAAKLKLLQFVAGVHIHVFWLAHLIWDILLFFVTSLICCVVIKLVYPYQSFSLEAFGTLLLAFLLFGFALLSLIYFISLISSSVIGTFLFILILSILGCIAYAASVYYEVDETTRFAFRVIPQLAFAECFHNIILNLMIRNSCSHDILKDLSVEARCTELPECCTFTDFLAWSMPGTLRNLVFLLVTGMVLFLCVLICATGLPTFIWAELIRPIYSRDVLIGKSSTVDKKVVEERLFIEQSSMSKLKKRSVVAHKISKFYGLKPALKKLSFTVKRHESFGVVGAAGSGKSTLCKIIVGAVISSHGTVMIRGVNVKKRSRVRKMIGYCPSKGGIFDDFTVRQNLRIYFLLRGVNIFRIENMIKDLATKLSFSDILDKPTNKLKAGDRRKINIGISVIGFPQLLVLDNPLSDCDPVTRRQMWKVLRDFKHSGKAILLSTSSIWESRKLCKRTAILVNGRIRALGTPYHIRTKYSKSVYIIIKIRRNHEFERHSLTESQASFLNVGEVLVDHTDKIKRRLAREFPSCLLAHESTCLLTFVIPAKSVQLSNVFTFIEQHRYRLNIDDYIITQTMLDQILVNFAFKQERDTSRMLLAYF